jgi:hypothetical protein
MRSQCEIQRNLAIPICSSYFFAVPYCTRRLPFRLDQFLGGRPICQNGLVCPTGELGGVSVRHAGDDIDQRIVDATYRVVTESVKALDTVKEWKEITLNPAQQLEMAVQAMGLKPNSSIRAELLLAARREADQPDGDGNRSLWVTMNTLEENMIRGGIKGVNERGRRISTKAVRQIDLDFRIHLGLWELAREYAKMN